MDEDRSTFELDDLAFQPGTYFNPQTEVLVIVDDTASIDQETFDDSPVEGGEWVRVSEEPAVDEHRRDELLEEFQARHHADTGDEDGGASFDDDEELEPDEDDPDERPDLEVE